MPNPIPATLIAGDGIGPKIVAATIAALDALGAPFAWDRQIAGLEGVKTANDPLPAATLESIRRTRLALKGPLETPSGGGYRSCNVRLRENLEGLYIGYEHYIQIGDDPHAVALGTGVNTRDGSRNTTQKFTRALVARIANG
jgi:isocitrate dehydrogenase (NAD+)